MENRINIGFAFTGSFCCHKDVLDEVGGLVEKGYNIIPILTPTALNTDTRFGTAENFRKLLFGITGNQPVTTIVEAEPLGPKGMIDVLVVAPCTGNTLSKLANGITDNAVTMVAKAMSRNYKPVVVGISTNDGLGLSLKNIATLVPAKNYYFVPFGQDNPQSKPKSLIAKWSEIERTIEFALNGKQIQPILTIS